LFLDNNAKKSEKILQLATEIGTVIHFSGQMASTPLPSEKMPSLGPCCGVNDLEESPYQLL